MHATFLTRCLAGPSARQGHYWLMYQSKELHRIHADMVNEARPLKHINVYRQ